jgi:AAA15 family ATPase/GTPase
MIIEFSVTNFRSIHQKQVFSMVASSAKSKPDNIFEHSTSNGDTVTLTKAAVIYGANASGKSNMIRALWALRNLLTTSDKIKINEPLSAYDPFLFDAASAKEPAMFEIIFIAKNNEKYRYSISFNAQEIIKEELFSYPKSKKRELFTRPYEIPITDDNIHIGRLGKELNYKKYETHKKLPLLSIFGKASTYHKDISPVYAYFEGLEIGDIVNSGQINRLVSTIKSDIQKEENGWLKEKIEELVRACDTQIQGFQLDKDGKNFDIRSIEEVENNDQKQYKRIENEVLFATHFVYENNIKTGTAYLPFKEESLGTNRLFALGGLMLKILKTGGTIIFDELDTSLHPYVSRFLVRLFLNPMSNPHNAQLIFTTHEPTLMDRNLLRADQIWFADKSNPYGKTEIFSAQDFDGVREDIPFDKWYMAGKFGAIPQISEINFIAGHVKEAV